MILLQFTPCSLVNEKIYSLSFRNHPFYPIFSLRSLLYIMAPKSELWRLYHTNRIHYKTDKSHLNAYCVGCMKSCTEGLCSSDSTAVATGELPAVRKNEELKEAGQRIISV
jgi:hypothetical protein